MIVPLQSVTSIPVPNKLYDSVDVKHHVYLLGGRLSVIREKAWFVDAHLTVGPKRQKGSRSAHSGKSFQNYAIKSAGRIVKQNLSFHPLF